MTLMMESSETIYEIDRVLYDYHRLLILKKFQVGYGMTGSLKFVPPLKFVCAFCHFAKFLPHHGGVTHI